MADKLSTLLSLRERQEKDFKNGIDDLFNKFKNKQGMFKGSRKTYNPKEGFADEPNKKEYIRVVSTVDEQLAWFKTTADSYFKTVFSIEKTNASNTATADLIVDGNNWGTFSSLELLRLKGVIDGKFKDIYKELPVRSEQIIWESASDIDEYKHKGIKQTTLEVNEDKTTINTPTILPDPHVKESPNRAPQVVDIKTTVVKGITTSQQYSGELTMFERANMLVRIEMLSQAIIIALDKANNAEIIESKLGDNVLNFINKGTL